MRLELRLYFTGEAHRNKLDDDDDDDEDDDDDDDDDDAGVARADGCLSLPGGDLPGHALSVGLLGPPAGEDQAHGLHLCR